MDFLMERRPTRALRGVRREKQPARVMEGAMMSYQALHHHLHQQDNPQCKLSKSERK